MSVHYLIYVPLVVTNMEAFLDHHFIDLHLQSHPSTVPDEELIMTIQRTLPKVTTLLTAKTTELETLVRETHLKSHYDPARQEHVELLERCILSLQQLKDLGLTAAEAHNTEQNSKMSREDDESEWKDKVSFLSLKLKQQRQIIRYLKMVQIMAQVSQVDERSEFITVLEEWERIRYVFCSVGYFAICFVSYIDPCQRSF